MFSVRCRSLNSSSTDFSLKFADVAIDVNVKTFNFFAKTVMNLKAVSIVALKLHSIASENIQFSIKLILLYIHMNFVTVVSFTNPK